MANKHKPAEWKIEPHKKYNKHRDLPTLESVGSKLGKTSQQVHKEEKTAINKMFNCLLEKHTFQDAVFILCQILNMPIPWLIKKLDAGNLLVMEAYKNEINEYGNE